MPEITVTLLLRVGLAAVLGAVLGLERDLHGRPAGLRTHILVSMGSAVFTIISMHLTTVAPHPSAAFTGVMDPGRIAAQVVTGIGFLGAGAILKDGFTVRGLTTAAALWIAAAIGMAAGSGFYLIGVVTTLLAVFALLVLDRIEFRRVSYRNLVLAVPIDTDIDRLVGAVADDQIRVVAVGLTRDYDDSTTTARLSLRVSRSDNVDDLAQPVLARIEALGIGLKKATWRRP